MIQRKAGNTPRAAGARQAGAALAVLTAILLTAPTADAATRIYRTVDENGNVVFTDVPPKEGEPGQAVELDGGNTFTPQRPATEPRSLQSWLGRESGEEEDDDSQPTGYRSLSVASPANDQPLRDNAGNVTVTAAVEPQLNPAHTMQVYLDGELRQSGSATSFQLTNLDRGTHQVELRIVDAGGNTLATSDPTVFHLQRRSVILQPGGRRSN